MEVGEISVYEVKPLSSKKENLYLAFSFLLIILVAISLLKIRCKPLEVQKIENGEISSYKELKSVELGIYSEILNSLIEIEILKDEKGDYPNIEDLEKEEIPPYFRDSSWKNKGELKWNMVYHDDIPIYFGNSQNKNIGNFLLEIDNSDIIKSNIYYSKELLDSKIIEKNYDVIKDKMKKIVPYTGADERKKYREE